MLKRKLFTADHEQFRDTVRKFFEREIMPHHERWEEQGFVDREAWLKAGAAGLLCMTMPEAYGGVGVDRLYSTVMIEEAARVGASGPGFSLHSEIASPYINRYGSDAQKQALFGNTGRGMGDAPEFVKFRHIRNCHAADPAYGAGVAKALGLDLQKALASQKDDPMFGNPLVALPV